MVNYNGVINLFLYICENIINILTNELKIIWDFLPKLNELNDSLREGYKVRKQKIVWKFPNLGQTQVNFQTIFKVCRMVQFVQKCKENFFDF